LNLFVSLFNDGKKLRDLIVRLDQRHPPVWWEWLFKCWFWRGLQIRILYALDSGISSRTQNTRQFLLHVLRCKGDGTQVVQGLLASHHLESVLSLQKLLSRDRVRLI